MCTAPSSGCARAVRRFRCCCPTTSPVSSSLGTRRCASFSSIPPSSRTRAHFAALRRGEIPDGWPLIGFAITPGIITSDGADLLRLRGLVSREFGARRIEALRPRVVELTDRLLDDLALAARSGSSAPPLARVGACRSTPTSVCWSSCGLAARQLGNAVGVIVVPLPVAEAGPVRRLELIAAASAAAKVLQHPAYVQGLMGWLAAAGLALPLARRQRMVNLFVTNVPGPRDTLYLLGAPVEAVMPITGLAGNVAVVFAALSYRGRLDVVVNADADACPDVDVLVAGMNRAWKALTSGTRAWARSG